MVRAVSEELEVPPLIRDAFIGPLRSCKPQHILVLTVIVIIAFGIRFYSLGDSEITMDETEKMRSVDQFRDLKFWVDLEHPPLEKYMILISMTIFDDEDWSVKLPNAVLGALTPIVLFFLVVKLTKRPMAGVTASILAALSPLLIGYSLIAKEDTPVNFFSLCALLFLMNLEFWRWKGDENEKISIKGPMDLLRTADPRRLTGAEIAVSVSAALALSSKFTFVFAAVIWIAVMYFINREWARTKLVRISALTLVVFLVISWYYLNPLWLGWGIGYWFVEAAIGHSTYFLGNTYTYPPPWFYPVVIFGRVSPLIWAPALLLIVGALGSKGKPETLSDNGREEKKAGSRNMFRTYLVETFRKMKAEPGLWLVILWALGILVIMTLLPFKGVRYVQWLMMPMIILSSIFFLRLWDTFKGRVIQWMTIAAVSAVMFITVISVEPYYIETSYFLNVDSGVKDFNGQGYQEALEWMIEEGHDQRISLQWTKMARTFYANVTEPVSSIQEMEDLDIAFIILYIYDLQRDMHQELTSIARSGNCTLIHEIDHDSVTLVLIYRYEPFFAKH